MSGRREEKREWKEVIEDIFSISREPSLMYNGYNSHKFILFFFYETT